MRFTTILLLLIIPLFIFSQSQKDKITLTSGDTFIGEIIFQNEEILIIRTTEGARYQFQLSQVKHQEKFDASVQNITQNDNVLYESNFRLMPSVTASINTAKFRFDQALSTDVSLAIGAHNFSGKNWFVGGGIGLFSLFDPTSTKTENFLPLFVRSQANFKNQPNGMFWGIDVGYQFSLNDAYEGGLMSKVALGYSREISNRAQFLISFSTALRNVNTQLSEPQNNINYTYTGNTNLIGLGLNVGLMF